MDLKEHELEWVARHLGHDIKVHREFYRLHSNTAEVVKVGKLLLATEEGLSKYAGKGLSDVTLSDIEEDEETDSVSDDAASNDTGELLALLTWLWCLAVRGTSCAFLL